MGSWLDEVENLADFWAVPLEDTMYLKDVKEHRDTYGQAKDILDHTTHTLSLKLTGLEVRQPVMKVFEDLQDVVWKAIQDIHGMRSHTECLADTLKQAIRQDFAAETHFRAETAQAQSSEAGILEVGEDGDVESEDV